MLFRSSFFAFAGFLSFAVCNANAQAFKPATSPADSGAQLSLSDQAELLGALGFGALTLDAYYELTVSGGLRTDNHLKGIDKLAKEKWGVTFSELAKKEEAKTGRNYREEAHTLVRTVIQKFGGADTPGVKKWASLFRDIHDSNLKKFHAIN
jgi:hypothetical protein